MEVYRAQDQHFKSFTVENKMENPHKKRWSHSKLNINDLDVPFPKTLKFINELGKTFSIGKNGLNPLGIWPEGTEDIYF